MTNTFLNMPYALAHDEGKRIYPFGELLTVVKASSEQTGGAFNLFDAVCPPGFATPLHIHYAEDVAVFVLEGALTSFWGNDKCEARAGSFLFQPSGTARAGCRSRGRGRTFHRRGVSELKHVRRGRTLDSTSLRAESPCSGGRLIWDR